MITSEKVLPSCAHPRRVSPGCDSIYNVAQGYLQYGVPSVFSSDTILALINKATLNIAGNTINAQAIEHFILRKPEDKLIKQQMVVNELFGLESPDPNTTFALCCGTRSSPAVKIYTADGVTSELEKSKLEYLQAAIMVTGSKRISIPELLLSNMDDFAADNKSLMEWICRVPWLPLLLRECLMSFEFQYLLAM